MFSYLEWFLLLLSVGFGVSFIVTARKVPTEKAIFGRIMRFSGIAMIVVAIATVIAGVIIVGID